MCQPARLLQEKNEQFENTDPEGSREQVKTSAFFPPLLPTEGVYKDEHDHLHGLGLSLPHTFLI